MSEDKDSIKDVSDELTKPFVDELSSRLKIPFFGGFVFSWLVINWERVAILISSKENIYTRIDKIKKNRRVQLANNWRLAHKYFFCTTLIFNHYNFAYAIYYSWIQKSSKMG